jgi:glucose-1-phosphate cytidylyltransferase
MKVVIFCGGLGTRLREFSETIPKPLVNIGYRPIIWHLMKYYAHFGHKEFVLCQGYRGDMINDFFRNYDPYKSIDFVMKNGGKTLEPSISDIHDWTIQFAETGLHANIGERLYAVRDHLKDEEYFLANYADQLSDLPLDDYVSEFLASDAIAGFVAVRPSQSFHTVDFDGQNRVKGMGLITEGNVWINGGYMICRREIFDYIQPGEELVEKPFQRLISEGKLFAYKYEGFWKSMDTFKDKITFDRLHGIGDTPWTVWDDNQASPSK